MKSASKAKREAKRAEKKTASSRLATPTGGSRAGSKAGSKASSVAGDATPPMDALPVISKLKLQEDAHGISDRVTTGVLASIPSSRDVKVNSVSFVFHGKVLIADTTLELNYGRRYGLLGENGCGKSTLLKSIAKREYPIPEHIDIYLLNEPADASDLGALEWVVREAENELKRLENMAEDLLEKDGAESPLLEDLYEVCNQLFLSVPHFILPPGEYPSSSSVFSVTNCLIAYRCHGSIHLRSTCCSHSYRFGFRQGHYPQEDQGYVRRMAYASCPWQGTFRQAIPLAS